MNLENIKLNEISQLQKDKLLFYFCEGSNSQTQKVEWPLPEGRKMRTCLRGMEFQSYQMEKVRRLVAQQCKYS